MVGGSINDQKEDWPVEEPVLDETAILAECKKSSARCLRTACVNFDASNLSYKNLDERSASVVVLVNNVAKVNDDMQLWYVVSSSYVRNIRTIAWLRHFINNSKPKKCEGLSIQEFIDAETAVIRIVKQVEFPKNSEAARALMVE